MYSNNIKDVFAKVESNNLGLSEKEVEIRQQSGKNVLQEKKKKSLFVKFLEQFKNVLIIVLLISCLVSVIISIVQKTTSELVDAGIILFVVLLNAIIGLIQEDKAEKTMENLKSITKPYAKVLRDGKICKVKTEDLVLGDVVVLEAGDIVPADIRLFEVASLKIEESIITGESVPVEKTTETITKKTISLGDKTNMAFMGSTVTYGRAKGVITAIGMNTEMGKIADILNKAKDEETPITKRLNKTSKIISVIVLVICVIIFTVTIIKGQPIIESFMTAVAIAVCAIPEGLPTAVTITMAIGVNKMSTERAIVKKLPAVETLGSTQIICSDKTGTLTLNKMTVKKVFTSNLDISKCENLDFIKLREYFNTNKNISKLINCMVLCNDTNFKFKKEKLECVGDPTETALVTYAHNLGYDVEAINKKYKRLNEIPFDSERKLMTIVTKENNKFISYTKGACDNIITKCSHILDNGEIRKITKDDVKLIEKTNKKFGSSALRVLGYAFKEVKNSDVCTLDNNETNMVFVGLSGMIDPPRKEVMGAIKTCKEAGITPIMITGDHKDTAFAIAKELGIASLESEVITGAELDKLTDEEFNKQILNFKVYARVNPEHKVRIVNTFKSQNKIVAMTGDGVNDAPSLKCADIGIGMGITGTDVTKSVADVVLTDDNFSTIVTAVKEGRRIYSNIIKIIEFFMGTAIAELILLTTIMAIMGKTFFNPALILWINFVSDTFPALALGVEKAENDVLRKPPINNQKHLFSGMVGYNIIFNGIVQSLLVFAVYFISIYVLKVPYSVTVTMSFVTLCTMELFHVFNMRSEDKSLFSLKPFSNKWINISFILEMLLTSLIVLLPLTPIHNAFGVVDLSVNQWLISLAFSFAIIPIIEIAKIFVRMYNKKHKN